MRTIVATLVLCAAFAGVAQAGQLKGTVARFDPSSRTLTLQDGKSYVLPKDVRTVGITKGETVLLTYENKESNVVGVRIE